jgi:hypothetical protein
MYTPRVKRWRSVESNYLVFVLFFLYFSIQWQLLYFDTIHNKL